VLIGCQCPFADCGFGTILFDAAVLTS
jgi:hypothetical protein